ncbi:ABC transporter ATP-binding protein [Pararhizobium mangrovi]|uniref:ATP-binding cassette domain-containing protein n=1 Tax=Pararhizobium mangrovi TaxID=2590452 RepID=A0A506U6U8_9HYPH|nr:oligopeptide/dipeptide ABC transporter ATP-binding protein [Pararhizobium mangrovi]TPW28675.1 ATP-binding cassette domain-containing protein [Pararhizobium mangrovi]
MSDRRRDIVIETQDLVRHFSSGGSGRTVRAVDGVSLSVERGETFAIVRESGCGKSTLARLLLRLIEPTAGTVVYEGRDLSSLSPRQMRAARARLQFVFQDPFSSLNPRMTVGTLVGEPLIVHTGLSRSERRTRVGELLERVGLRAEHAERYPHEFSGGQRQRVAIARALASEPTVLVGDEPVSALDVSVQAQIINLMEELKSDFGLTLVVIAHDLAVIRHMSDRVAVMYLGEIVELAPADALFDAPGHPYTEALIAAIPVPRPGREEHGEALGGDIPSPLAPPSGCRFHPRCPYAVDRCTREKPMLETAGRGRLVACHRQKELSLAGVGAAVAAGANEKALRRFELYRQHAEGNAAGSG